MAEITKETIITDGVVATPVTTTPIASEATNTQTIEYLVYYIFGALEILLAFRLVLKMMGASLSSLFVRFIYGLTGLFTLPFDGIFRRGLSQGLETTSVLEPGTIVAIIVYAVVAWGIVKMVRISSGKQQS
jgi:hypothetical protein